MTVEFSDKITTDYGSMHLIFKAIYKGKNIKCIISQECLQDNFNSHNIGEVQAFKANQNEIFSKAEELIESGRFERDGSLFLRTSDFNKR